MSLNDLTCCQGDASVECNYCPNSPRYVTRRDIEIEDTRRTVRAAIPEEAFEQTAKRILAEGAQSALAMVEIALARGLTPEAAIAAARQGTDVWSQP